MPGAAFFRRIFFSVGFRLAPDAAVFHRLTVSQSEDVRQLLLAGCDAAGIFALKDVRQALGRIDRHLLDQLPVADDVDGGAGIDEADAVTVGDLLDKAALNGMATRDYNAERACWLYSTK